MKRVVASSKTRARLIFLLKAKSKLSSARSGSRESGLFVAPGEQPVLAPLQFVVDEGGDEVDRGHLLDLGLLQARVEDIGDLKRNGVTLQLLWEEHLQVHPSGYRYTQFCEIYRQWARRLRPSMRQVHRAGEKTFIDFSGKRPTLVDRRTGELRPVELFVAVLGASSLTYAEAVATPQLADWVGAHTRMVEYFGGATALWVPDQSSVLATRDPRRRLGSRVPIGEERVRVTTAFHGCVLCPARSPALSTHPCVDLQFMYLETVLVRPLRPTATTR